VQAQTQKFSFAKCGQKIVQIMEKKCQRFLNS